MVWHDDIATSPIRMSLKVSSIACTTKAINESLQVYISSLFDKEFISTGLKLLYSVGSFLFLINHGFLRGEMNRERWISVGITYLMPYLVNIYGQHAYRRKLEQSAQRVSAQKKLRGQSSFK